MGLSPPVSVGGQEAAGPLRRRGPELLFRSRFSVPPPRRFTSRRSVLARARRRNRENGSFTRPWARCAQGKPRTCRPERRGSMQHVYDTTSRRGEPTDTDSDAYDSSAHAPASSPTPRRRVSSPPLLSRAPHSSRDSGRPRCPRRRPRVTSRAPTRARGVATRVRPGIRSPFIIQRATHAQNWEPACAEMRGRSRPRAFGKCGTESSFCSSPEKTHVVNCRALFIIPSILLSRARQATLGFSLSFARAERALRRSWDRGWCPKERVGHDARVVACCAIDRWDFRGFPVSLNVSRLFIFWNFAGCHNLPLPPRPLSLFLSLLHIWGFKKRF